LVIFCDCETFRHAFYKLIRWVPIVEGWIQTKLQSWVIWM